jgi:hypothetical protein
VSTVYNRWPIVQCRLLTNPRKWRSAGATCTFRRMITVSRIGLASFSITVVSATILTWPIDATASRPLCTSVPAACEYTGPDAPWFGGEVCWSRETGVRPKGTGACPAGQWPYYLDYGEIVDPLTSEVAGYVPLDWACSHPGLCTPGYAPPGSGPQEQVLCCEWGVCVPAILVPCNNDYSIMVMCFDGVTNMDGTVECFEGDYPG